MQPDSESCPTPIQDLPLDEDILLHPTIGQGLDPDRKRNRELGPNFGDLPLPSQDQDLHPGGGWTGGSPIISTGGKTPKESQDKDQPGGNPGPVPALSPGVRYPWRPRLKK